MMMSPWESRSPISKIVSSVTVAGTITHTARGAVSFSTRSASEEASEIS